MNLLKTPLGLVLLFAGLIIIAYSLYASFNIFTAKTQAPEIFKSGQESVSQKTEGIQGQIEQLIQEQLKGMIPANSLTELLNLITWSIFAGILIFGGAQTSGIGIKLLK